MVDLLMKHIVAGTKVSQHLTHLGNDSTFFFIIYKYFTSELYKLLIYVTLDRFRYFFSN